MPARSIVTAFSDNTKFRDGSASDILEPSESFRKQMDYYSHTKHVRPMMARLAAARPTVLACMHGSAWQGDGSRLLMELAESLDRDNIDTAPAPSHPST